VIYKDEVLRRSRLLVAFAVATGLTACSSSNTGNSLDSPIQPGQIVGGATKQMDQVQPVDGFLPQPSLLQPGGNGRAALYYINPDATLSAYSKIMLDPVQIYTSAGSQLSNVPAGQRTAAANTFYSDLFAAMKKNCNMAKTPGPGTLRMKFALVDAELPNPVANTVATYVPYVSTAYSATSFVFHGGVGYLAGTATAEAYATDSATGALVWQAVDKRGGTTALVKNTFDSWLDVHHAFEAWSAQLVKGLQGAGICNK
jgi:hypothetical protein